MFGKSKKVCNLNLCYVDLQENPFDCEVFVRNGVSHTLKNGTKIPQYPHKIKKTNIDVLTEIERNFSLEEKNVKTTARYRYKDADSIETEPLA